MRYTHGQSFIIAGVTEVKSFADIGAHQLTTLAGQIAKQNCFVMTRRYVNKSTTFKNNNAAIRHRQNLASIRMPA